MLCGLNNGTVFVTYVTKGLGPLLGLMAESSCKVAPSPPRKLWVRTVLLQTLAGPLELRALLGPPGGGGPGAPCGLLQGSSSRLMFLGLADAQQWSERPLWSFPSGWLRTLWGQERPLPFYSLHPQTEGF